jgi:hypothetical protein
MQVSLKVWAELIVRSRLNHPNPQLSLGKKESGIDIEIYRIKHGPDLQH